MYLCLTTAEQRQSLLGTMVDPVVHNTAVVCLGESGDASSFLVLTEALDPTLTRCQTVPDGYVSVFPASLRLPVTDTIVHETIQTLRRYAYPDANDYLDGIAKGDTAQVQTYIDACLAVKARYVKGF